MGGPFKGNNAAPHTHMHALRTCAFVSLALRVWRMEIGKCFFATGALPRNGKCVRKMEARSLSSCVFFCLLLQSRLASHSFKRQVRRPRNANNCAARACKSRKWTLLKILRGLVWKIRDWNGKNIFQMRGRLNELKLLLALVSEIIVVNVV